MARMRATTVRFGGDLWEMLEREASRTGVSIAQYVRESALARLAYAAGRRGDPDLGFPRTGASEKHARMNELAEAAEAVRRQGNQAVRHAEQLLEDAKRQQQRGYAGSRSRR
jgi:hypothetical protein